ncbi:MAG: PLP-dependent transferase [Planctomycetes bacterium]|nr:PLP-dependent transferase [Planctomycetota bacterium]
MPRRKPAAAPRHGRFPRRVGEYTLESYLLHVADPEGSGPIVPSIPVAATYRAADSAHLAGLFGSILGADPAAARAVPEGAHAIYQRLGNPVEWLLARAFALAQGGESAIVFSDGMRAISACLSSRSHAGSEVVCGVPVYGCTDNLFTGALPRDGRTVHFVDLRDLAAAARLFNRRTRVVYCETLANPNLRMVDLAALKRLLVQENSKRHEEEKITLIIDNTFATPFCCWPHDCGPELREMIVVHSATKGISGFATGLAGVAVIPWKFWMQLFLHRKDTGGSLPAVEAHSLLVRSMKTLALRIRRQVGSAWQVARFLESHAAVAQVLYPGLRSFEEHALARRQLVDWDGNFSPGHMISFILKGRGPEEAEARGRAFLDRLNAASRVITLAVSLGYVGTLIEEPSSGTHASMPDAERRAKGIPRGLLRLSVGLEEPQDLIRDLERALARRG